jgi:hypothetical protein
MMEKKAGVPAKAKTMVETAEMASSKVGSPMTLKSDLKIPV